MTDYRISEYPSDSIGLHYSVDFKMKGQWFVRSLHRSRQEAEEVISVLTKSKSPV